MTAKCGYCNDNVSMNVTPSGKRYCPNCKAVRANDQGRPGKTPP